jgi:hypothetical protein
MSIRLNESGVIAPGTGPSRLNLSAFGLILWLVFMGVYFSAFKIMTGRFPLGGHKDDLGLFIGIIGTYFIAWIIDFFVGKRNNSNSQNNE